MNLRHGLEREMERAKGIRMPDHRVSKIRYSPKVTRWW
jgi:hypothetical protein